jgi:starch phosphorylase
MPNPQFTHSFEVVWDLPESLAALKALAMNYRWTWHHETRDLFRSIDPPAWESHQANPIAFLRSVDEARFASLAQDQAFLENLRTCHADLDDYLNGETWYGSQGRGVGETFAYFCAEFGISEGLPIYSGGLGVLAGDHMKAASDLGLPIIGVGLLYSRGYFHQRLNSDGWQQESYQQYDFYNMPLTLIRTGSNEPLRIELEFPDRNLTCQVWRAEVGRVSLYLLDSNVLENSPSDKFITDTLYGGNEEMRMMQEIVLGIGGLRMLRALGIHPTVCHMNEGHAAFLSLERIKQYMADNGCDFKTARQVIVNGNVFTTHTPVPAGFDLFPIPLIERYLGKYLESMGLPLSDFVKLGRIDPENEGEAFNMAVLAMENANHVNGVSKLHAKVTRGMFQSRWPEYPESEVPIGSVTNGIHTLTWVAPRFAQLFDQYLGPAWRDEGGDAGSWERLADIPDHEIWMARDQSRAELVRFVRSRVKDSRNGGVGGSQDGPLDPNVLTLGFARRFATYKRATLMLSDRRRLLELLHHPERPIQIVIAGKSHPRDDGGKRLIQDLVKFIREEAGSNRIVFVEDYDMQVARNLVQGVDVWLNNPRRPMEASGTSGMKVVPNGGINCSVLDGWWDEGYEPDLGFAIGDRESHGEEGHQDWLDSRSLYTLIESEIAPAFYNRNPDGIPVEWVKRIRTSMARLAPTFSTARMVREYAERFYFPASAGYASMSENGQGRAKAALEWRSRVRRSWDAVRVLQSSNEPLVAVPKGEDMTIRADVNLGTLNPGEVKVQALVGRMGGNRELVDFEVIDLIHVGKDDGFEKYERRLLVSEAGHRGYTIRVVPHHTDVQVPGELNLVRWQ